MKVTGDLQLVKRMNKSIILEKVRSAGPISRASISSETGLNKGTVSNLVSELITEHFIIEKGTGLSSGGRKPVMLHFHAKSGYAIGIDLGVNYLRALLTDLDGSVEAELVSPINGHTLEEIVDPITHIVKALGQSVPACPYGIVGIGIGVPGMVDESGIILSAPNLGWQNKDLQQPLQEALGLTVWIDNEANAGALGEKKFGAGRSADHFIYVSAGIGIGAGLMIDGSLYRGSAGFFGEMGHLTIETNGRLCRCGNKGCWEMYASENALLQAAVKHGLLTAQDSRDDALDQFLALARSGHPEAARLLAEIGTHLGIGIAGILNTFNPQTVIVGSRLLLAREWLEQPLLHTVEMRALQSHRKQTNILYAELGLKSSAMGAASMAIEYFIQQAHEVRTDTPISPDV